MAGTRNVRLIVTLCHNQNQRPEQAIDKESAKTEPRLGRMRRQRSSHQAKSQGMLVQRNPKHPACQARRSVERKSFSLYFRPLTGSRFSSGRPLSAPLYILHTSSGIPTERSAFSFGAAPPFSWSQAEQHRHSKQIPRGREGGYSRLTKHHPMAYLAMIPK